MNERQIGAVRVEFGPHVEGQRVQERGDAGVAAEAVQEMADPTRRDGRAREFAGVDAAVQVQGGLIACRVRGLVVISTTMSGLPGNSCQSRGVRSDAGRGRGIRQVSDRFRRRCRSGSRRLGGTARRGWTPGMQRTPTVWPARRGRRHERRRRPEAPSPHRGPRATRENQLHGRDMSLRTWVISPNGSSSARRARASSSSLRCQSNQACKYQSRTT